MGGVSNAAQGGGGAVQTISEWGGSHPMCWSCRDGLQPCCCFLVALVSRADPALRNFEGGFLWLTLGRCGETSNLTQPHLPPAGMSPSSPAGLESIKSCLPVPPSRNLPMDHARTLLFHGAGNTGGNTTPTQVCQCCGRCREAEQG